MTMMNRRVLPTRHRRRDSIPSRNNEHQLSEHDGYDEVKENWDVVCGRGRSIEMLPGNIRFRDLVQSHQAEYEAAKVTFKRQVAERIVALVQANGGRFLKKVSHEKPIDGEAKRKTPVYSYQEMSDHDVIINKVCQSFRDLRRQQPTDSKPEQSGERSPSKLRIRIKLKTIQNRPSTPKQSSPTKKMDIVKRNMRCLPLRQNLTSMLPHQILAGS